MALEDTMEDRLRELLRDPAWSLPTWPDPHARVRRAARRQRARLAGATAAGSAIAAVVVACLAGFPGADPGPAITGPSADALKLPALGAAGFPASIYPAASTRTITTAATHCPDTAGLEPLTQGSTTDALAVVNGLGSGFTSDLRLTDRAYWPQVQASWREGAASAGARAATQVLYSGPLQSAPKTVRAQGLSQAVLSGCGNQTTRDTWLIVTGQVSRPAQQAEFLLLERGGHVLVWSAQK